MHDLIRHMAISIAAEGKYVFMVSHEVNSEEFPKRTSYERYNHMSIVAMKFDGLPKPISFSSFEFLMLKLFEESFRLEDDFFFVRMSNLNVLCVRGAGYGLSISAFSDMR